MANARHWLAIRDFLTFRPTEVLENKRFLFETRDAKSDTGHSLLVRVDATHAGIVNGNRKFYRPDKMSESVHTWLPGTNGYRKPVLIGHNEDSSPLGRVLEAKYVDDSWKWAGEFPTIKDSIFYSRDSKRRSSLFKSVDWIVDNLQPLADYTGLGHCELGLRITNPEGIRKVLTDEYLTVSTGAATDEAFCSICHQDWTSDDKCEHKPGGVYDGKRMFLICGRFKYQELSFVNFPADPFALVKGKELQDSLEKMFFLGLPIGDQEARVESGLILTDSLYESDISISAEDTMKTLDVAAIRAALDSADLTADQAFGFKDQVSAWEPETDDDKVAKRSLTSSISIQIRKRGFVKDAAAAVTEPAGETLSDEQVQAALQELEDAKKKAVKKTCKDCGQERCKCTDKCQRCQDEFGVTTKENLHVADDDSSVVFCEECWDHLREDFEPAADETEDKKQGNNAAKYLAKNIPAKGTGKGKKCESNTPEEKMHQKPQERPGGKKKKKKCAACTKDFETENEDQENCDECSLTDSVKHVIEFLAKDEQTKEQANAGSEVVALIKGLDAHYSKIADGNRFTVRIAVRCLIDHWSADDELKYWLQSLAKQKDSVVVSNADVAIKDTLIADLTTEKDGFESRKKALEATAAAAILDSKHSLASQIVIAKVLKGADGYKGLDTEQIQAKVEELTKRSLLSLKDTVTDLLSELEWATPEPAANPDQAATEPEVTVNDNEQVVESESTKVECDFKVQDTAAYRRALSYITNPAERKRFEADVRWGRITL